ncbi:MAG: SAM-dependent DNA methyltransferase [Armatimonadetes bacterium]|nr:SAM-dependent DNA methyltransferase [Armatimonadota bacterium]
MKWIAPRETDAASKALEKKLWDAADQFRANSGLTAAQYSQPILGLIFLRFADARFQEVHKKIEAQEATGRRTIDPEDVRNYHAAGVVYLPPEARYETLLTLPEGANVGENVNTAMRGVERANPQLAGTLPKTFNVFGSALLKNLLRTFSEIKVDLGYDAFGRIYEYFLGEFARTEGSKGGEFYTPSPIVRLLVEVIEPYHGRILDPACGSGGMFVQSARFVAEHKKEPGKELSIYGVEKTDATGQLCRMNLAVHGLEGDIKHGGEVNSYYDDPHRAVGRFDFVLANPPFNVNAVDKERLKDQVGPGRRFPFGLPKPDNANYLWIQLFYSSLNDRGRAGFVMASGCESASSSEMEIRKQIIQDHAVDVMIAVGPKLFYTVPLGCMLWILDRGKKGTDREGKVLFLDARQIWRDVDRAHRDWMPAQVGFLANVVRLYRGEEPDYTHGGTEARAKLEDVFGTLPTYADVLGLCKVETIEKIEAQGWSLNPGRYVGVASGEEVSDEDFKDQLAFLHEDLEALNTEARGLEDIIARNVQELLEIGT